MSTDVKDQDRLRWFQYIGPWQFHPWVFALVFAMSFGALATGQSYILNNVYSIEWIFAFFLAIVAGALMGGVLSFGKKWQQHHGVKWGSYLFFPSLAIVVAMIFRFSLNQFPGELINSSPTILGGFVRNMLLGYLTLGVAGTITYRLEREIYRTSQALAVSREQQQQILEGDEQSRRQISELLHDKVQAGLIAACLELRDVSSTVSDTESQRINHVIQRLEGMRARDVRSAARILSPSLKDIDLQTALEELAAQYEPSIEVIVHVDSVVESLVKDPQRLLGMYRMTEQALLNAAHHGGARLVRVDIQVSDTDGVLVQVIDDGSGVGTVNVTAGVGFALFTTWTRSLGGSWKLEDRPSDGCVFTADIPIS